MKIKRMILALAILFLPLMFLTPVKASNETETVTEVPGGVKSMGTDSEAPEQVRDSVVQIVLQYVDESGSKYLFKSGSGFLIGESTVLTSYSNVTLTDEERSMASQFVSEQTGKEVNFGTKEGSGSGSSYQIGVVIYRDVVFEATLNTFSSKEMDLAILNVAESLNRSRAILGDADELENGAKLQALGYKEIAVMTAGQTELLSQADCKSQSGSLSKMTRDSQVKYLAHTCKIDRGNTGGPVIDDKGYVVGLSVYHEPREDEQQDSYRALSVNEIKGLLDSCEIAYQESGLFTEAREAEEEAPVVEEEPQEEVNTNLLDDYIVNFNMLEPSNYTEESFGAMRAALEKAREVKADKDATQEEVDNAVAQLEIAKTGLVMASKINWPILILVIVLILLVIGGLVTYILYLKGVIGHRGERESMKRLQGMMDASRENLRESAAATRMANMQPQGGGGVDAAPVSRPVMPGVSGNGGTTVLQSSVRAGDGTTVLGTSSRMDFGAYMTRLKTSEKIMISQDSFVIGKDPSMVHYCISDNPTISREHAKIVREGGNFFLVDLNSTNSTYHCGKLLHPGEESQLRNGDTIRFSDDEFVFNLQ
ncbi:MAG: FHA domain-containing protein [Lachnospiraceae bacterium]|nr:FHA domain-containing protein [Lachnospiraceae bacterium]